VVGDGPLLARLQAAAPANVEFTGHLPRDALRERLRSARAFLFVAVEDFGIAPVEAMACGTPVIALRRGGVAETVLGLESENPTGVFMEEQSAAAVVDAIGRFEAQESRIKPAACRARAEKYAAARFRREFTEFVAGACAQWHAQP